jgi:pyruvate dehydrogenase E2 component (dihydrolipoamide acetyltransferase)
MAASPAPLSLSASALSWQHPSLAKIREIFMPSLSSTITEGKIVSWTAAEGDRVNKGDAVGAPIALLAEPDEDVALALAQAQALSSGQPQQASPPSDAAAPLAPPPPAEAPVAAPAPVAAGTKGIASSSSSVCEGCVAGRAPARL